MFKGKSLLKIKVNKNNEYEIKIDPIIYTKLDDIDKRVLYVHLKQITDILKNKYEGDNNYIWKI